MPKYENSIIYKLCHCNDLENENIYIGSTSNFTRRKCEHKYNCNNEKDKAYNIFVYNYIRNNGGWDVWQMIPIEVFPCNNKKELEIRERHHIELLRPNLNKQLPTRTSKEYYKDTKEKLTEKAKEYYNSNKKQILERHKKYYNNNKEQLKEQYEANKEKKAENDKKYYEKNKKIINEKAKEKVICDHCGCGVRKQYLKTHQKTKKCIDSI